MIILLVPQQNFHQMAFKSFHLGISHIITLVDENGLSVSRQFEILEKKNIIKASLQPKQPECYLMRIVQNNGRRL